MMDSIIDLVIKVLGDFKFLPLFSVGLFASLFAFWGTSYSHKDRNSIFDMWIFTIIVSMCWARLSFIIANWETFRNLSWSLAPYERYGESVYFFRLLPWKFFDLSDGGFLFTSIFVAYLLFGFLYNVVVKKWRWREMFFPVVISAEVFLSLTLIVYGALTGLADVVSGGLVIALIVFLFLMILAILKAAFRRRRYYNLDILNGFIHLLIILFVIISFTIITRIFFSYEISFVDRINVIFMNIGGIVITLYFLFIEKTPVETKEDLALGKSKSVTININKPFKLNEDKD